MSANDNNPRRFCDQLGAYELGLLASAERAEFESHLDDCPECLPEMYVMAPAAVALTTEPRRFLEAARTAIRGTGQRRSLAAWFGLRGALRLAVPVAAMLAIFLFWPRADQAPGFGSLALVEPVPYSRIDVRGSDELVDDFTTGMTAYQDGDYGTAAADLSRAAAALAADPEAPVARQPGLADQIQLYLAVSLLLDRRPDEALPHLTAAAASPIRPVKERALWYRAQAELQLEQPEAALSVLDELGASPVYGSQARDLIARIRLQQQR